ncbi:MAG: hypothetical protein ACRYG4_09165, partial [Janthinobacterium lividum]
MLSHLIFGTFVSLDRCTLSCCHDALQSAGDKPPNTLRGISQRRLDKTSSKRERFYRIIARDI